MSSPTSLWRQEVEPILRTIATVGVWIFAAANIEIDGVVGEVIVEALVLVATAVGVNLGAAALREGPTFEVVFEHANQRLDGHVPIAVSAVDDSVFLNVRLHLVERRGLSPITSKALRAVPPSVVVRFNPPGSLNSCLVDRNVRGHAAAANPDGSGFRFSLGADFVPGEQSAIRLELLPRLDQGPLPLTVETSLDGATLRRLQRWRVRVRPSVTEMTFSLRT